MNVNRQEFSDRAAASSAAAKKIAERLEQRLRRDSAAAFVISGGSTPAACLDQLSRIALDWPRVSVLLSDERWVPVDNPDSNEGMARATLLVNAAHSAQIVPVFDADTEIAERCRQLGAEIAALSNPFAISLLGMGEDGHFASLFPDAANLALGLDLDSERYCIPVTTAASPLQRVSLSLAALARSDEILLLIFGETKRQVFETALQSPGSYPVADLLALEHTPVSVYWAP